MVFRALIFLNLLLMLQPAFAFFPEYEHLTREDQREINISSCFEYLEPLKDSAILGFHTFTGCDLTGKVNGKYKCRDVFKTMNQ